MLRGLDAKTRFTALALVGVTSAFVGYGGFQMMQGGPNGLSTPGEIAVHIAGAIAHPGVHYVRDGALVEDAIQSAGGELEDADLSSINLAAKVQPNSQLYIPVKGERIDASRIGIYSAVASSGGRASGGSKGAPIGVINLNTASKAELDSLPRVGPAIAQRIIDYRTHVGTFNSVDELLGVKGIGPKTLEQIRPHVTVR